MQHLGLSPVCLPPATSLHLSRVPPATYGCAPHCALSRAMHSFFRPAGGGWLPFLDEEIEVLEVETLWNSAGVHFLTGAMHPRFRDALRDRASGPRGHLITPDPVSPNHGQGWPCRGWRGPGGTAPLLPAAPEGNSRRPSSPTPTHLAFGWHPGHPWPAPSGAHTGDLEDLLVRPRRSAAAGQPRRKVFRSRLGGGCPRSHRLTGFLTHKGERLSSDAGLGTPAAEQARA